MRRYIHYAMAILLLLGLSACAGGGGGHPSPMASGNAVGGYKIGPPYEVSGVWYYPKEDFDYDETGIASWYGPGFHGRYTANGEAFDTNELTGAHKTLPLPSLVRVTNLENGRQIVVRINDRGPFVSNRIIDLSKKAAQLLGFDMKGTAKVRVQILAEESRLMAEAARRGEDTRHFTVAGLEQPGGQPEAAPRAPVIAETLLPPETPPVATQEAANEGAQQPPGQAQSSELSQFIAGQMKNGRFMPAPVVTTVAVDLAHTSLFVQAGAFAERANADKLKLALSKIGPTSVVEANIRGQTFYRVRVGPFRDVPAADSGLAHVIATGQKGARIIVD